MSSQEGDGAHELEVIEHKPVVVEEKPVIQAPTVQAAPTNHEEECKELCARVFLVSQSNKELHTDKRVLGRSISHVLLCVHYLSSADHILPDLNDYVQMTVLDDDILYNNAKCKKTLEDCFAFIDRGVKSGAVAILRSKCASVIMTAYLVREKTIETIEEAWALVGENADALPSYLEIFQISEINKPPSSTAAPAVANKEKAIEPAKPVSKGFGGIFNKVVNRFGKSKESKGKASSKVYALWPDVIVAPTWNDLPPDIQAVIMSWDLPGSIPAIQQHFGVVMNLLQWESKKTCVLEQKKRSSLPASSSPPAEPILSPAPRSDRSASTVDLQPIVLADLNLAPVTPPQVRMVARDNSLDYNPAIPKKTPETLRSTGDAKKLFKLSSQTGKGGFGTVFLARSTVDKTKVAVKRMPHVKPREKKFNYHEIQLLDFCRHPNVVQYKSCYEVADEMWVVMEFMEGGTLTEASKCFFFSEGQIAYVAGEVLKGLSYLHKNNLIHRDLKSSNIMMTISGDIKLIDFGLCTSVATGPKTKMCGSPLWMPPEMMQKKPAGPTADIWCLAISLLELANRTPCTLPKKSHIQSMFVVGTEGIKEPLHQPDKWSPKFKSFLHDCLQFDPDKRPNADELLERHPFLEARETKQTMAKILSSIFIHNVVTSII